MKRKGAIVISEAMLLAFGIVISFILMATMGSMIFSSQAKTADESALTSVAKDIAFTIDDVAAEAGSVATVYKLPKGMETDIEVDYKLLKISVDDKTYGAPFQALTHTRPYTLNTPRYICFVKNQDDMRISLSKGKCICNTNDKHCDPACIVTANCDPACNKHNVADNVCDRRCSKELDRICDLDCYQNDKDGINEALDCTTNGASDRICDPDSHMEWDGICDLDCLDNAASPDPKKALLKSNGICDPECTVDNDGNRVEDVRDDICDIDCLFNGKDWISDGICDLDCAETNLLCDPDCDGNPTGEPNDLDCASGF